METNLGLVPKGRLSVADALQQLDTVNNAFMKVEKIEKRQVYIDAALQDITKSMENFASNAFLNSKLEEFSSYIKKTISQKFEEFSSNYLYQLNEKAGHTDVESLVSQRVTWLAFNNFSQQFSSIKSRLEKHILSDFEGFKAKVKLELSHKAEEKKGEEDVTSDEIQQLRNRITGLEQKYHEMFMEEGLDDSEEYDSQEEMDNFNEDFDKKGGNSEDGIGEEGQEEEYQDIGRKVEVEASVEVVRAPLSVPLGKIQGVASPEVISPRNEANDTAKTEVSEEAVKVEQKVEVVEKIPNLAELENRAKSRTSIEIDNNESPSPKLQRNRGSSRADGQTLSRKNSMSSSIGGGGMAGGGMNGGVRQLNKKVTSLQKDLESYKSSLDQITITLQDFQKEFEKVYDTIKTANKLTEEVEIKRQGMEMSFIKALRRNGIDKKQKKQQIVNAIDSGQLVQVYEAINRKNKKIKTMATYVEKAAADMMVIKDKQNGKINEIVRSVKFLDESRVKTNQLIKTANEDLKNIDKSLKMSMKDLQKQIVDLQGPMTDLISDQQRENEMLSENIKSQQVVLNALSNKISPQKSALEPGKHLISSQSPSLSVKHKLSSGFRRTSVPTSKNWLEDVPDGVPLTLPRVPLSSQSKKLSF